MSFIYKYKTLTLTPFVKPHDMLNLAVWNIFYVQLHVESAFTYNPGSTINLMRGMRVYKEQHAIKQAPKMMQEAFLGLHFSQSRKVRHLRKQKDFWFSVNVWRWGERGDEARGWDWNVRKIRCFWNNVWRKKTKNERFEIIFRKRKKKMWSSGRSGKESSVTLLPRPKMKKSLLWSCHFDRFCKPGEKVWIT